MAAAAAAAGAAAGAAAAWASLIIGVFLFPPK